MKAAGIEGMVSLKDLIKPQTWLNIPPCITNAFKSMIEYSRFQEKLMEELNSRVNKFSGRI